MTTPFSSSRKQCHPASGPAAAPAEVERGKPAAWPRGEPGRGRGRGGAGGGMRGFVGFGVTSAVTLLAMVQLPAIFDSLDQR